MYTLPIPKHQTKPKLGDWIQRLGALFTLAVVGVLMIPPGLVQAAYLTDPSQVVTSSGSVVTIFKELSGYDNYGEQDGAADILYSTESGTWQFDLAAAGITPSSVVSAEVNARLALDDHYDRPASDYTGTMSVNGQQEFNGNLVSQNVAHGVPFSEPFNNWATVSLENVQPSNSSTWNLQINNTTNGNVGGDWIAVDWIELRLTIATQCQTATAIHPQSPGVTVGAGWFANFDLSDDDGLVAKDVSYQGRVIAKNMSLPYLTLKTTKIDTQRIEVGSNVASPGRTRLVDFSVSNVADNLNAEATYLVDQLPGSSAGCLEVKQTYRFLPPFSGDKCEPSGLLGSCARFYPLVSYNFTSTDDERLVEIHSPQRLYFTPDGDNKRSAGLFRDSELPLAAIPGTCSPPINIFDATDNPVPSEISAHAITEGQRGEWDNIHITTHDCVDEPPSPSGGCPSCVHIHWYWGGVANWIDPSWPTGVPLIPLGSRQSVNIALVDYKNNPAETDPTDYNSLVNKTKVKNKDKLPPQWDSVFWYEGISTSQEDSFFIHGGFIHAD